MREIEVKAKLTNKEAIINKLQSLGCVFEDLKIQNDVVYVEKIGSFETFLSNKIFLRVRKSNEKIYLTLKMNGESSLSKIEHEVEVSSRVEIDHILKHLKFTPVVKTNKKRLTTHYKGFEICVDFVEDLGDFIEVEKVTNEGDSDSIQEEMFDLLKSLGIKNEDQIFEGYDILALKQNV